MQCALQLEKNVNQALLDLHKLASDHSDPHVSFKRFNKQPKAGTKICFLKIFFFFN